MRLATMSAQSGRPRFRTDRRARTAARPRRLAVFAVAVSAVLGVSGCGVLPGLTVEQIPLPAPGNLGDTIDLSAKFDNALNLPTRAKVKLSGMDVGEVTGIHADNYQAIVDMRVSTGTKVPVGTGAELRQATPLGDVFVALLPPKDPTSATMIDGDTLSGPTSAAATVEDLLVATAGVVDSGSLNSLQRILNELSTAIATNPTELSGAIEGLTEAITKFNKNSAEVDLAMRNTQTLTGQLYDGRAQIMASINKLAPAIDAVNGQMSSILTTLDKSNTLTAATNDFLNTNGDNLVEMFEHLSTILAGLDEGAPTLLQLADNLHTLTPKWAKSTPGSAAAVAAKVYYLTPGVGFDSASRLPELGDVDEGTHALQQTIARVIARLTGTAGCCG